MNRKFEKVADIMSEIDEILEKYGYSKNKLIKILQVVQEKHKYLSEEVINYIAAILDIPAASVYGVVTFYSHFSLKPKGKYVIKLCDGTACHVKGSIEILDVIKKELGLDKNITTTDDMLFTVETVSCLGACGLAPAVVVNDKVYGQVKPDDAIHIINEIRAKENYNKQ